jgi:hypothetical protein
MSEITDRYHIEIDGLSGVQMLVDASMDKVTKMLAGVENGAMRAVYSAMKRAAASAKTAAKRAVTQEYTISQQEFLKDTWTVVRAQDGDWPSVTVKYAGFVIPLLRFNTNVNSDGKVVTQVKRHEAAQVLDHAFLATVNGSPGIYQRVGPERTPIKQLYGPATPQMMTANETVQKEIGDKMVETYEKRIDHEIDRLLNGWGKSR